MRTILRADSVLGFLVAGALGLACSTENEPVGVARDAVSSDAFLIACETSPAPPSGATHGTIGLAAWTPGSSVHAARFDSDGNVLDGIPIDLGLPAPVPPFSSTMVQGGAHVLETATGFAVVIESDDCGTMMQCFRRLRYRTIDPSGALGASWEVAASVGSTPSAFGSIAYLGGGFDGAKGYLAYATTVLNAGQPAVNLYASSVEAPPVTTLIAAWASPATGIYYNPVFYAFGCRTGGCLVTYREATLAGPGNNKAGLLGQPAIDAPNSDVGSSLIGTPSGFLQAQVGDDTVVTTYSALGVPTSTKIPVWGLSPGTPSSSNGLVSDGSQVRAIWATLTGLDSGTFSDAGVVSDPPAAETTAADEALGATATFGAGRTLVVLGGVAGIEGRFIGSIPASVPAGCPSPTTTSASSASASGTGGAGATSASAGGAGGAGVTSASAGGAGGAGTSSSGDATTSATVAQSSSSTGGGSGGAPATTSNGSSSSAAVTTGNTGAATAGGSTVSSGGGGNDGGTGVSGGCSVGSASPFESTAAVWTSTLLAIAVARMARRGRPTPADAT